MIALPNLSRVMFFVFSTVLGGRVKRQETDEEELERQLCEGKGAGEWFRLETGNDKCRDVIQCTASVRKEQRQKQGQKRLGGTCA